MTTRRSLRVIPDVPLGAEPATAEWMRAVKESLEVLLGVHPRAAAEQAAARMYERVRFVDRGPADYDWTTGDFVKDGNWHTLELAPIVPAGAVAIVVRALIDVSAVGYGFALAAPAAAGTQNRFEIRPQVAGLGITAEGLVALAGARQVAYSVDSGPTWSVLSVVVRGWFI